MVLRFRVGRVGRLESGVVGPLEGRCGEGEEAAGWQGTQEQEATALGGLGEATEGSREPAAECTFRETVPNFAGFNVSCVCVCECPQVYCIAVDIP